MNLVPLSVESVLDVTSDDANAGTDRRQGNVIGVALAGGFGIRLGDGKPAHDLEDQISAFVADVTGV